jgi:hypothetical protein
MHRHKIYVPRDFHDYSYKGRPWGSWPVWYMKHEKCVNSRPGARSVKWYVIKQYCDFQHIIYWY